MTTKQFAEAVLAGIPWYIYLLTFIGLAILVRDTYNKVRRMYDRKTLPRLRIAHKSNQAESENSL
jgi:hypothetical protein